MKPLCFSHQDALEKILLAPRGQGQNLTLGQGREVIQKGHVAYHLMRLDERNAMRPTAYLYISSIESYWQKAIHDLI